MEEIKLDIPKGYEFVGVDDNAQKVVFRKIQPEYPKTYEECCEVLFPSSIELGKVLVSGYNCEKLKKFGELLICRDAYWKIAGWRPTKDDDGETFSLFYNRNSDKIDKCDGLYGRNDELRICYGFLDFTMREEELCFKSRSALIRSWGG